jgi:REP element-mobilizing transposase RayT
MIAYRPNLVAGGTDFFTLNLADRRSSLLTDNIGLLRAAFWYSRHRHPFTVEAIVILPDHLHALWTLPVGDSDFSNRWRLIQTTFSRGLPPRRARFGQPIAQARTRHLATPLLGAHDPRASVHAGGGVFGWIRSVGLRCG